MTVTDQQSRQTQAGFDRRIALGRIKARLAAIGDTLSDSRIDAGQLHKDVEELNAITGRITWLADISTPRLLLPLHEGPVAHHDHHQRRQPY
jgi:hypothetical protein